MPRIEKRIAYQRPRRFYKFVHSKRVIVGQPAEIKHKLKQIQTYADLVHFQVDPRYCKKQKSTVVKSFEPVKSIPDAFSMSDYIMANCCLVSQRSPNPSIQVGVCIVQQGDQILTTAYNGMYRKKGNAIPYYSVDLENSGELHAIVCLLAKNAISIRGSIIYSTHLPCNDCINTMLKEGIKQLIYMPGYDCNKLRTGPLKDDFIGPGGIRFRVFRPTVPKVVLDFTMTPLKLMDEYRARPEKEALKKEAARKEKEALAEQAAEEDGKKLQQLQILVQRKADINAQAWNEQMRLDKKRAIEKAREKEVKLALKLHQIPPKWMIKTRRTKRQKIERLKKVWNMLKSKAKVPTRVPKHTEGGKLMLKKDLGRKTSVHKAKKVHRRIFAELRKVMDGKSFLDVKATEILCHHLARRESLLPTLKLYTDATTLASDKNHPHRLRDLTQEKADKIPISAKVLNKENVSSKRESFHK